MAQERPILDNEAVERLPRIISIWNPLPIPEPNWNEEPTRCFRINEKWIARILGVMDGLDQPDAWEGTEQEIFDARQNVREIMLALSAGMECGEMPMNYIVSLDGCNSNGQLEYTAMVDGVEQTNQIIDLAACLNIPETYVKSFDGCAAGVLSFTAVTENIESVVTEDLGACLDGIIVGEPGEPGGPGEPGEPGQPGADCTCEDLPAYEPPAIESEDAACGMATYLINWNDDRYDDLLNMLDTASDLTDALGNISLIFGPYGVAASLVVDVITEVFGTAISALRSDVPSTKLEEWTCELWCYIQDLAVVSAVEVKQWIAIQKGLETSLGAAAWLGMLEAFTTSEINMRLDVGATAETGDCALLCDECDEDTGCLVFDFTTSNHGWNAIGTTTEWVLGVGWRKTSTAGNADNVQIDYTAPEIVNILSLAMETENGGVNSRLIVGGVVRDTGDGDLLFIPTTPYSPLETKVVVGYDYQPGSSSTHPQIIKKITICTTEHS